MVGKTTQLDTYFVLLLDYEQPRKMSVRDVVAGF